jgi:thioredoxin reductase (NADPH)
MKTTDPTPDYDVIIVGAGPAGLTAATYLGRFRRKVLILDGGPSRAGWIPESHNTPGFPRGVGGPALLADMGQQTRLYGAERRTGRARTLARAAAGFELALNADGADAPPLTARFVLLATGVVDRLPDLPGVEAAIRAAKVRMCPICDAYEAIDQKIAVLGEGELGAREATFLTTYSKTVSLLHLGPLSTLCQPETLKANGVEILPIALPEVSIGPDRIEVVTGSGARRAFDCLYLALGCEMQSRLAVQWGAAHDAEGNLIVNAHQETSIERLYAAGDVVRGLNQIAVATGEAAIAATDIHKHLRELDG